MTHAAATLALRRTRLGSAQREPRWWPVRTLRLLVALLVLSVPKPSLADPGEISTAAGGPGQGPALSIGQTPAGVVASGPFVYVADSAYHVVRRLDTRTGRELLVAGNGTAGFSGDGGPATSAQLNGLAGVAVDAAGNLFIADTGNGRIRRVDTTGTITTVAGGGSPSDGLGDGGPATSAQLNPSGVAVDAAGNLFIADTNLAATFIGDTRNNRIRKVDTGGTITTVAGNGACQHWGCSPVAPACGCVVAFGGDDGPATSAQLLHPSGVAVDAAGNLFIADTGNNRIRMVDTAGTITTVAGSGNCDTNSGCAGGFSGDSGPATSAQLSGPAGVAVDAAGNLFIPDDGNKRLRKVDTTGTITTVAGNGTAGFSGDGGPATSAQLNGLAGVAVDAAGNLFIADTGNNRIRMVDPTGTITTVAGTGTTSGFVGDGGPATSAQLNSPLGVAVDAAGNLFIPDDGNKRLRKVDTTGTITTVAGNGTAGFSGDGGPATSAQLNGLAGVAVDAAGNLFIADTGNNRIRKVDTTGTMSTVAGGGSPPDGLGDGGLATSAQLDLPWDVAVDAAGNLFIAEFYANRIRKVDTTGTISTVAGNGTYGFSGDGGPATSAQLSYPRGVAVDAVGNLFIADSLSDRIRMVDPTGMISTVAGGGSPPDGLGDGGPATSAQLDLPWDVAADPAGHLLVADRSSNRIRKIDTRGTITTVAGNGTYGFSGDGGPATSARLSNPFGVAVDGAGNLFIADTGSNRIRMVEAFTTITPTSTPTATLTLVPSATVTATPTQPATASPAVTRTPSQPPTTTPTATPTAGGGGGGGCTVAPGETSPSWPCVWVLLPLGLLVRRRVLALGGSRFRAQSHRGADEVSDIGLSARNVPLRCFGPGDSASRRDCRSRKLAFRLR